MNPFSKKLISLFLVFSLLVLSVNLYAKKRQGAKLVITKKNGQLIEGELITVKKDSLLLLLARRMDVSVGIEEIKVITLVKESKFWTGGLIGLLIGGGGTALSVEIFMKDSMEPTDVHRLALSLGLLGGLAGYLIGAIFSEAAGEPSGKGKTVQIEGMTDLEIQEIMDYLRKKARIRDCK